jgi:hypothetical protein
MYLVVTVDQSAMGEDNARIRSLACPILKHNSSPHTRQLGLLCHGAE